MTLNLLDHMQRVIHALPLKPAAIAVLAVNLMACQQGDDSANTKKRTEEQVLQQQFQAWLKTQPNQPIQAYQQLLARHLQHPPCILPYIVISSHYTQIAEFEPSLKHQVCSVD